LENGDHLVCDSKTGALLRYDGEGNFLAKEINGYCAGEIIRVPNDVIVDKNSNIYFTDSVRHKGKVGFISYDGKQKILAENLDYPNGLALSNDEKILFIAESYQNRIIAFDLSNERNIMGKMRVVSNLPRHASGKDIQNLPDGIKVDKNNNLWVAHYGMGMIYNLSPEGNILYSIPIPFTLPSNLFIRDQTLMVTGGYAEPGPGGIIEIELHYE
jgi:gluconolactonase